MSRPAGSFDPYGEWPPRRDRLARHLQDPTRINMDSLRADMQARVAQQRAHNAQREEFWGEGPAPMAQDATGIALPGSGNLSHEVQTTNPGFVGDVEVETWPREPMDPKWKETIQSPFVRDTLFPLVDNTPVRMEQRSMDRGFGAASGSEAGRPRNKNVISLGDPKNSFYDQDPTRDEVLSHEWGHVYENYTQPRLANLRDLPEPTETPKDPRAEYSQYYGHKGMPYSGVRNVQEQYAVLFQQAVKAIRYNAGAAEMQKLERQFPGVSDLHQELLRKLNGSDGDVKIRGAGQQDSSGQQNFLSDDRLRRLPTPTPRATVPPPQGPVGGFVGAAMADSNQQVQGPMQARLEMRMANSIPQPMAQDASRVQLNDPLGVLQKKPAVKATAPERVARQRNVLDSIKSAFTEAGGAVREAEDRTREVATAPNDEIAELSGEIAELPDRYTDWRDSVDQKADAAESGLIDKIKRPFTDPSFGGKLSTNSLYDAARIALKKHRDAPKGYPTDIRDPALSPFDTWRYWVPGMQSRAENDDAEDRSNLKHWREVIANPETSGPDRARAQRYEEYLLPFVRRNDPQFEFATNPEFLELKKEQERFIKNRSQSPYDPYWRDDASYYDMLRATNDDEIQLNRKMEKYVPGMAKKGAAQRARTQKKINEVIKDIANYERMIKEGGSWEYTLEAKKRELEALQRQVAPLRD